MTKQLRDQIAREAETRQFQSFVRLSAMLTHDLKNGDRGAVVDRSNMESHFDNKTSRRRNEICYGSHEQTCELSCRLSNPGDHPERRTQTTAASGLVPILKHVISDDRRTPREKT